MSLIHDTWDGILWLNYLILQLCSSVWVIDISGECEICMQYATPSFLLQENLNLCITMYNFLNVEIH